MSTRLVAKPENIRQRKNTLIKKAYELGMLENVEVAVVVFDRGRYSTYTSMDSEEWPPSMSQIVSLYNKVTGQLSNISQRRSFPLPVVLGPEQVRQIVKKRAPVLADIAATHRERRDLLFKYETLVGREAIVNGSDKVVDGSNRENLCESLISEAEEPTIS